MIVCYSFTYKYFNIKLCALTVTHIYAETAKLYFWTTMIRCDTDTFIKV